MNGTAMLYHTLIVLLEYINCSIQFLFHECINIAINVIDIFPII